jgi:hypothetical protein
MASRARRRAPSRPSTKIHRDPQLTAILATVVNADDVGCHSVDARSAPRLNRARYSASDDTSTGSTFSASRRGSRGCWASWTSPMPPEPTQRTIVKPAKVAALLKTLGGYYEYPRFSTPKSHPRLGTRCLLATKAPRASAGHDSIRLGQIDRCTSRGGRYGSPSNRFSRGDDRRGRGRADPTRGS